MKILYIIVEGQVEEDFVKNVIKPHLLQFGIQAIANQLSTNAKGQKGGGVSYYRAKRQISIRMKNDPSSWVTTMFDFYKLDTDFPKYNEIEKVCQYMKKLIS